MSRFHFIKKHFTSYWIRSAFFMFLQRFAVTLFGFLTYALLVRHLSLAQMGTFALFLIITTTFELSKSALLKGAHIRFASAADNERDKIEVASSAFFINLAFNLLFIALILLFSAPVSAWFNAGIELSLMLKSFIPGLIAMVFFSHFEAIQQSNFDFKGVFAGYLVRQISFFLVVLVYFVFKIPFNLSHLALYQALSIFLGTAVLYVATKKYLAFRFEMTVNWIRRIFGFGGYIFGSGIISNVFANLDQLMTSKFLSTASMSFYNAASRISGFIDIPSYAATEILFPKMSQASAMEGTNKVKYFYEKMISILLSFIVPLALFIILFPKFIITIIAGSKYHAAAPILQLYMLNSIIGTIQNQSANTLNSIGKPRLCLVLNAISLSLKLIVTFFALKYWGFYGAAIATVLTSFAGSFLWYFTLKKEINVSFPAVFKYIAEFYKMLFQKAATILKKNKNN